MPTIQSARKRMRQTTRQRARNRAQLSAVRTAIKKVRQATSTEEAQAAYHEASQLLDRAARKGLIAKNNAARNKRRLHKHVTEKAAKK